jgi:peroxiredoxin
VKKAVAPHTRPAPKTVVFFIRNFWCGQCQDYTFASLSLLDREAIEKQNIRVVVISNGSWKFIKSYRKLLNCPFPIYVDGSRRLFQLLG